MRLHKTFVPFLLSMLIVQWTALPLLWQWQMAMVHEAAEAEGMNENTSTFTLTRAEWINERTNEKEINLNGLMYDVQSITMDGDLVHLKVKRDTREEKLLVTGTQITHHHQSGQQHPDTTIADIFSTVYLVPDSLLPHLVIKENDDRSVFCFCETARTRATGCLEKPPQPATRPFYLVG